MGLSLTFDRAEGRQGISLAALAAAVEQGLRHAAEQGVDPDTIEPTVRTNISSNPKIRKLEIEIP